MMRCEWNGKSRRSGKVNPKPAALKKDDLEILSEDEVLVTTKTKVIFESGLTKHMWKAIKGYFEETAKNKKIVYMGLTSTDGKKYLI